MSSRFAINGRPRTSPSHTLPLAQQLIMVTFAGFMKIERLVSLSKFTVGSLLTYVNVSLTPPIPSLSVCSHSVHILGNRDRGQCGICQHYHEHHSVRGLCSDLASDNDRYLRGVQSCRRWTFKYQFDSHVSGSRRSACSPLKLRLLGESSIACDAGHSRPQSSSNSVGSVRVTIHTKD